MPPPFSNKITQDTPPLLPHPLCIVSSSRLEFPNGPTSSQAWSFSNVHIALPLLIASLSCTPPHLGLEPDPPISNTSRSRPLAVALDWSVAGLGQRPNGCGPPWEEDRDGAKGDGASQAPPPRLSHLSVAPPCSRATWSPGPVRHLADSALSCRSKVLISVCGTNGQMRASRITSTFHHHTPRLFLLPLLPPGLAATPSSLF